LKVPLVAREESHRQPQVVLSNMASRSFHLPKQGKEAKDRASMFSKAPLGGIGSIWTSTSVSSGKGKASSKDDLARMDFASLD
jgi:hypothetical protein